MLGFLNLFKPAVRRRRSSARGCGASMRRSDGAKLAVGTFGTFDPQAAGVLPMALGKATVCLPLIEDRRKAYAARSCWAARRRPAMRRARR